MIGVAFVAGLLAGFLGRGSLANLAAVRIAWTPVLFASLAVGMVPFLVDVEDTPRQAIQLASHAGILAFLAANIWRARGGLRAGFVAAATGWFLNFITIAPNGGMPLSRWAWARSGQTGEITPGRGGFFKGTIAGPDTVLRPLGDVIPVRVILQVISIGDILILLGIAIVIAAGMRTARVSEPAQP